MAPDPAHLIRPARRFRLPALRFGRPVDPPARRRSSHRLTAVLVAIAVMATVLAQLVPGRSADASTDASTGASAASGPGSGPWVAERLSVGPEGTEPDGGSSQPSFSADGASVAFVTDATNLTTPSHQPSVVVRSLADGSTTEVSRDAGGVPFDYPRDPDLSADGHAVVMSASSGGERAIARVDRAAGTAGWVGPGVGLSSPEIDDAGDRVVFVQGDTNPFDDDHRTTIWLRDDRPLAPDAQRETNLSMLPGLNDEASKPVISADGNTVAYLARIGGAWGVRVHDLTSQPTPVPEWYPGAFLPALSADGRLLVTQRYDSGLSKQVVVRHDRITGEEVVATALPSSAAQLDTSADGSVVAYSLTYRDDADESRSEIRATTVATGRTEVVATVDSSPSFDLSSDGRAIAFSTSADGVVAEDTNRMEDVFVARHTDSTAPTWPPGAALVADAPTSSMVGLHWAAATDETSLAGYVLEQDGQQVADLPATATSYQASGLTPDTTYTFRIVAVDGDGNASAGLSRTITTEAVATEPGTAALVATAEGGAITLHWDLARDPIEGYRVLRAEGDGELTEIGGLLPPDQGNLVDPDRTADTTYRYAVDAVRDGEATRHSVEATVVTPSVRLDATSWTGSSRLGGDIAVTLTGAPGWNASAEVAYRTWYAEDGTVLASPRQATTVVAATPDTVDPQAYHATFPVSEGVAEVTSVTGVLADDGAHVQRIVADHPRMLVDAALSVTIVAPAGSLAGSRLVVPNVGQAAVTGGGVTEFPVLPVGTRRVQVLSSKGLVLAEANVEGIGGQRSRVTLTPAIPTSLAAHVVDEWGVGLAGARVVVQRPDGTVIGGGTTSIDGVAETGAETVAGDTVVVKVTSPAGAAVVAAERTIQLVAGRNVLDVTLSALPTGSVVGTVRLQDGSPARGARVVLSELVDGRSWSYATETDAQGRYRVTGLAGSAQLSTTFMQQPPVVLGPIVVGGADVTRDITLPIHSVYTFSLSLFTRTVDDADWQGPLDLDWAAAIHYRLEVRNQTSLLRPPDETFDVIAKPGDQVSVCVKGDEAGMTSACQTVTVGDDRNVPVELRLESVGRVQGRLIAPAGLPNQNPSLQLLRLKDDGTSQAISWFPVRQDGRFSVDVATAGRYRVAVSGWGRYRMLDVDVAVGDRIDLGDLLFTGTPWTDRSVLNATRRTVLPGGRTEIRAQLLPGMVTQVHDATARFTLPAGVEVVEGSVLLDGQPVDNRQEDGQLLVTLPDRTFTSAFDLRPAYVVRYQLQLTDAQPGDELQTIASVVHSGDSGGSPIAGLTVDVAAVTIDALTRSATRTMTLTGWAPPGTTVQLTDGGEPIGQALTGPGGIWSLNTELPDLGNGAGHALMATVELDGQLLASAPRTVVVDERLPQLQQVTLSRPGSSVTFDPRKGTARFPMVYRGTELTLDAEFGGEGVVDRVDATIGSYTGAAHQTGDHTWQAKLTTAMDGLGPIDLDFEGTPSASTLQSEARPTVDQLRRRLPAAMADFGEPTVVTHPPSGNATSASFTAPTPGLGEGTTLTGTMTLTRGQSYTPTAADLLAAKKTGTQMWGTTFDYHREGDQFIAEISGYVPESLLNDPRSGLSAAAVDLNTVRWGFKAAFSSAQAIDSGSTASSTQDKYDRLNRLLDSVNANCDSLNGAIFRDALQGLNEKALATDAMHASLMLAGVVLAPETFGVGTLVVWGATFFLDKQADYLMDQATSNIASQIAAECPRPDNRPPDDPQRPRDDDDSLADPVWIHDPSGYVFEAVPSNRVEGATATLLHADRPEGPFAPWDAEWFGQLNPLTTDEQGAYGWDVPEGFWQVVYTKDGYDTARSDVLEVLPPRFDVNEGLVSHAAPEVQEATAAADGAGGASKVEVTFSRYMELTVGSDRLLSVTGADGSAIAGRVDPVDAEDGPTGRFARTFRFTPASPLALGAIVQVAVDERATSYAGVPMAAGFSSPVEVSAPPAAVPVATEDQLTVAEDVTGTVDVLANDTGGAAALAVVDLTQPAHGSVAVGPDGRVSYTPQGDFHGTDSFTYAAGDGVTASTPVGVEVVVTPVADAPKAEAVGASGDEDTTIVVDPLASATDADGDHLTVASVSSPSHGAASVRGDGTVDYRPAADWNGTDTFTVVVTDGVLASAPVTATVTVRPVQDPPRSTPDSVTTRAGTPVIVDVLANDVDPDGEALTAVLGTAPTHGAVVVGAERKVTYTPATGWSGTDTFTYQASDPQGGRSSVTTVTVTVTPGTTGPVCTITGTEGRDLIHGTRGNDVICGLGGDDVLYGEGGNDTILGGAGIDVLIGGAGNDTLDGGNGSDYLEGDGGDDTLLGGGAVDLLAGGAGNDLLDGGDGVDAIDGGAGRDGWKKNDQALAVLYEYRY